MIGGATGAGKAYKHIKKIFAAIMALDVLSTFTWSGRGKGIERKNAFEKYHNVQKLIFTVLNLIESNYSMDECIRDMKQKIFKYAYLHSSKNNDIEEMNDIVENDIENVFVLDT